MENDGRISRQRKFSGACIAKAMALLPLMSNGGGNERLLTNVVVLNA